MIVIILNEEKNYGCKRDLVNYKSTTFYIVRLPYKG